MALFHTSFELSLCSVYATAMYSIRYIENEKKKLINDLPMTFGQVRSVEINQSDWYIL